MVKYHTFILNGLFVEDSVLTGKMRDRIVTNFKVRSKK